MFATKRVVLAHSLLMLIAAFAFPSAAAANRQDGKQESPSTAAIDKLIEQVKTDKKIAPEKVDAALGTIHGAARSLPPEELLEKLDTLQKHLPNAIPTRKRRLRPDRKLDRHILMMQLAAIKKLPPEKISAHPCAEDFPGPVSKDAERISREVEIKTDVPGWHNYGIYGHPGKPYLHSTGLYAAPGEAITVTVPESVIDKGLSVRIGCHTDRIGHDKTWARPPEISRRFPITAEQTKAANAFGGLVYIETPFKLSVPAFKATIDGAVAAPDYIHGVTSVDDWRKTIRNNPAPWGELRGKKLILTLPAADLRTVDDPKKLMDFWDGVMDLYAELLGREPTRRRIERFVPDLQISAGYMHSGYPLMTMLDITNSMIDIERIQKNGHHGIWGLFHEIGHNHQNRDWTYGGTTEVTVNLFSLYVMEKVCKLPIAGHGCVTPQWRAKRMKKYFDNGTKFDEWKSDPFLALAMYIELQQKFGWEPFTKVFREYRAIPPAQRPRTDDQRRDQWMVRFSKTVGRNLGPFFQSWGVPTSDSARKSIADLPEWMPNRDG